MGLEGNISQLNLRSMGDQVPVVERLDGTVCWIDHYPLDDSIGFDTNLQMDNGLLTA